MTILTCGINHKTAPLALREKVAFLPHVLTETLQTLKQELGLPEVVILSTCNRTEIYCAGLNDASILLEWLKSHKQIPAAELAHHWYVYKEVDAVKHAITVATGLDSMMLGEPEIFGQMKNAYQMASHAGTIKNTLQHFFQYIFSVTKKLRTESEIGQYSLSIAGVTVQLASQVVSDLNNSQVLLIGSGDIIESTAHYLNEQGVRALYIANRTIEKAEYLAQTFNATAIPITSIPLYLQETNIVISATACPVFILDHMTVAATMRSRMERPLFLVDLAVPRDIEPSVSEIENVHSYCIDDLQKIVQDNSALRKRVAEEVILNIDDYAADFFSQKNLREAAATITAYRERMEQVREFELAKALQRIQQGFEPHAVLAEFSRALTNKLIHTPTIKLREAGSKGENELLSAAQQLFALHDNEIN
jgi:glutamyl-tRNA reductase